MCSAGKEEKSLVPQLFSFLFSLNNFFYHNLSCTFFMEFEEKSIPRIQYQIFYQNFEVLLLLCIFDVEDVKDSYFVEVVTSGSDMT